MEKTRQKAVRKAPGMGGHGRFYRIEVRPKGEFVTFRTQDVGKRDGLERVAGRHPGGSWETATWLVEKKDAHGLEADPGAHQPPRRRGFPCASAPPRAGPDGGAAPRAQREYEGGPGGE